MHWAGHRDHLYLKVSSILLHAIYSFKQKCVLKRIILDKKQKQKTKKETEAI